jgi:beta-galactosidase
VARGAEVIAGYGTWPVKDFAAVTRNAHGSGHGWYVGTILKEEAFYDRLVAALMADAGVKAVLDPPDGVEVSVREGDGRRLLFVINHTEQTQTLSVPAGKRNLLAGGTTGEALELEAYGVAVILL